VSFGKDLVSAPGKLTNIWAFRKNRYWNGTRKIISDVLGLTGQPPEKVIIYSIITMNYWFDITTK
jgi:hypothetical protein